mmetsp:Transcript_34367/g.91958  ORF Transcript_34367/g.91958 Transcript_34367/m.91958 type:complete len:224 (+) Transcript_34367:408-1079(+)
MATRFATPEAHGPLGTRAESIGHGQGKLGLADLPIRGRGADHPTLHHRVPRPAEQCPRHCWDDLQHLKLGKGRKYHLTFVLELTKFRYAGWEIDTSIRKLTFDKFLAPDLEGDVPELSRVLAVGSQGSKGWPTETILFGVLRKFIVYVVHLDTSPRQPNERLKDSLLSFRMPQKDVAQLLDVGSKESHLHKRVLAQRRVDCPVEWSVLCVDPQQFLLSFQMAL